MVMRSWRGFAAKAKAHAYPDHLLKSVRPKLEQLNGFRGLYLLRRLQGNEVEFRVLTLWESMEAVRSFAGDHPDQAVVEPEARAVLIRFDSAVEHYEVVAAPT
jgi:heme-degrading monooxygenase HmoA